MPRKPKTKSKKPSEKKKSTKSSISEKSGLVFPVGRIRRYLRKGRYSNRVGLTGSIYLASVLEYVVAEILELAGEITKKQKKKGLLQDTFSSQ